MNWRFWSRQDRPQPDTCESIEPLLSLYSDGMTSPSESRQVESHLAECPECRQALEWMEATRLVIAKRPAAIPPPDLRLRIAQAIAAEAAAENTAFRPAPRSFVTKPAFAMAASVAIIAAFGWRLSHTPHAPAHLPSPVNIATNPLPTTSPTIKPSDKPVLPPRTSAKSAPLVAKAPPQHLDISRPAVTSHADTSRVAKVPEDNTLVGTPRTTALPIVNPHPVAPRVKAAPLVAVKPAKTVVPRVSVKSNPSLVAVAPKTEPLQNSHETVIVPAPTTPDTTAVVHPDTPPVVVAVVPHAPPVTHVDALNHQLAALVAYKSDNSVRHVSRDINAHVQMAAYNPNGQAPFVQAPAVYTPGFNDKPNKQMAMASEPTMK